MVVDLLKNSRIQEEYKGIWGSKNNENWKKDKIYIKSHYESNSNLKLTKYVH